MFINAIDMTVDGYRFIEEGRMILPAEIVLSKYLDNDKIQQIIINNPLVDTYRMQEIMYVQIKEIPSYALVSQYIDDIADGIRSGSPFTNEIMEYINIITSVMGRLVRDIVASVERFIQLQDMNSYLRERECQILAKKIYMYLGLIYTINPEFDFDNY